jgi:hypothetical protein
VHEKIRADPMPEKKERSKPEEKKTWKPVKLTYEERKERLKVSRGCHLLVSLGMLAGRLVLLVD